MQVEKYIYKAEEEQINISQILVLYSISELFGFSIILKENLEKSTDNQQIANYELVQNGFGRVYIVIYIYTIYIGKARTISFKIL